MDIYDKRYKYCIIQFLEPPQGGTGEFRCVPRSWIRKYGSSDKKFLVTYPDEDPEITERRIRGYEKCSQKWDFHFCCIVYGAYDYDGAMEYILYRDKMLNKSRKSMDKKSGEFCTPISKGKKRSYNEIYTSATPLEKETTPIDAMSVAKSARMSDIGTERTIVLKIKLGNEVTTKIINANECVETEDIPVQNEKEKNGASNNMPVEPTALNVMLTHIQEMFDRSTEYHQVMKKNYEQFIELMNKATTEKTTEPTQETEVVDIEATPQETVVPTKEKTTKKTPKETPKVKKMPQKYKENSTKWTLKHQQLKDGLIELIDQSGIYVDANALCKCLAESKDCNSLARNLLMEVFSLEALKVCSMASTNPNNNEGQLLDRRGIITLIDFVEEFADGHWPVDRPSIIRSIKHRIRYVKKKFENKHGSVQTETA